MAKLTTSQGVTVEVSDEKAQRMSGPYWQPVESKSTGSKTGSSSKSSSK
jgi:hypothetical protein